MPETARPFGGRAVMEQRSEPHDSLDDFPTPPWATRAMIERVIMPTYAHAPEIGRLKLRTMSVREPCANRGYMVKPLAEYFGAVFPSDIFDYGYGYPQLDYLFPGDMSPAHWSIFNPPFALALQFIQKSFETPGWVGTAALVRTAFLEGTDRYEKLYRTNPPNVVAPFAERVVMHEGKLRDPNKLYWNPKGRDSKTGLKTGALQKPSTATSYCWLVWFKDVTTQSITWIRPIRRSLERPDDYPVDPSTIRPSPETTNGDRELEGA